jgi:hypothetical protein
MSSLNTALGSLEESLLSTKFVTSEATKGNFQENQRSYEKKNIQLNLLQWWRLQMKVK